MIVNPEIEQYILDLIPRRDEVLAEMEEQARRRQIPIVGPAVGSFLAVLVRASRAKRIFELGSAIGYSTLWLARAAGPGAEVHYSDAGAANAAEARAYFGRAGIAERIHVHVGDAIESFNRTEGDFDFIFNDVDKEGYPAVLRSVPGRLRRGGLFVTDNALWSGRVLRPEDAISRSVADFVRMSFESSDLLTSMIPLRDGLTVSVRL